jgi:DNA mismatch repair protein MSH2
VKQIDAEYKTLQKSLVSKAVETAMTYLPIAEASAIIVAELDCLSSFAVAAALAPNDYTRPTILSKEEGVLDLKNARHPCVELMVSIYLYIYLSIYEYLISINL